MTPSELLVLFRLEVDDAAEPFLWSDMEFGYYLNDAQDVHIRLTGGIADRTSPLTKVIYKAGDQFVKYDPRILHIKGAWDEANQVLTIKNIDNFERGLDDGRTGPIQFLITDVEEGKVQLYPIPAAAGWIKLYVYRRPLQDITAQSEALEVPAQFHLNLLNWVKYKAYLKQDVETFNTSRADEFKTAFVDGLIAARREKSAREDSKRLMAYGGI